MNSIRKKLHVLENYVLPENPDPATVHVKNNAEIALLKKANQIRRTMKIDVTAIWHNDALTFEQKYEATLKSYSHLSEEEQQIVSKDTEFYVRRLQDILIQFFAATFPTKSREPLLRVTWFFQEMNKLAVAKFMEDSEWTHHRHEEEPDFDDFQWWDDFNAKVKQEFPDGVFTEQNYEKIEEFYDNLQGKLMREYWQAHPEAFNQLLDNIDKPKQGVPKRC